MKSGISNMIRLSWTLASCYHSMLYLVHNLTVVQLFNSSEKQILKWIWNARSLPEGKDQGGDSRTGQIMKMLPAMKIFKQWK